MLDKVLSTIKQANLESTKTYECDSCGNFAHMDFDNERSYRSRDTGETIVALICDDCIRRGWDYWRLK